MFTRNNVEINGTHLQGYVATTFDHLLTTFGYPTEGDGYKIDAEWDLQFNDGTIATIYNWKDGHNYNDGDGVPVELITAWHIGGFDQNAVDKVKEALCII